LIWVENSANRAGGTIFPQSEVLKLRKLANERGLGFHLDGARIWNVTAATGKTEAELAAPFDSINVCLSKGLGAPVGSLIIGSVELIDQAHRYRKRLGGGMRQAGIIAAAGLYAVENNRSRLVDDHRRAKRLAEAVNSMDGFVVDLEAVATNIIIFDTTPSGLGGIEIATLLKESGVWGTSFGGTKVRVVTHLDVNDDDIDYSIKAFAKVDKIAN